MFSLRNSKKKNKNKKQKTTKKITKPGVEVVCACGSSYSGVEAGGLLEPRRSRLQGTVITPLHSSLGNRARYCLKKKKRKRKKWGLAVFSPIT